MSLVDSQSRNFFSPGKDINIQTLGKRKAEICSSQLELEEEEKKEVQGEAEAEEEVAVEENGGEEEAEDEEFELCGVCLKDKEHWTDECPYLDCIRNPTEVTLGKGYEMACKYCDVTGGHPDVAGVDCDLWEDEPDERWVGRAIMKVCDICRNLLHDYRDCPYKDNLPEKNWSL